MARPSRKHPDIITVRLSPEWAQHLRAEAIRHNLSLSEYLQAVLQRAAEAGVLPQPRTS